MISQRFPTGSTDWKIEWPSSGRREFIPGMNIKLTFKGSEDKI